MRPELRILLDRAAAELAADGRTLEQIGAELCAEPDLAGRHGAMLQSFDHLAQRVSAIAALLAAPDPEAAVADVPLQDLQDRLDHSGWETFA